MTKRLPIGIQDFRKLIEGNHLYVDKTEHIHRLIRSGDYFFLSRPRRFGKSLLINTLKEIFLGNQELFRGLWIYDKIDTGWESRPVIHIDFSSISLNEKGLKLAINDSLDEIAAKYGLKLKEDTNGGKFSELIKELGKEREVAILIDEYDKPIVEYIDDLEKASENRSILKNFYSVIKGSDSNIHFFLITGVSKFSKVSIFSDLNNLTDISFDEEFGTLLGYTQEELGHYFPTYLERLGRKYEGIYPDIQAAVKLWYNGYSWDGKHFVYNPFSILSAFRKNLFRDYWFETGTPTWLIRLFNSRRYLLMDLKGYKLYHADLNAFDVESLNLPILLLQTGYLTVKDYDIFRQIYTLDFPNKEVEFSFSRHLLNELSQPRVKGSAAILDQLADAFNDNQIEKAIELLTSLFANVAYPINANAGDPPMEKERYFHSIFFTILKLLGFLIEPEVLTHNGRIDAVIQTEDHVYIIEFKMGDAGVALEQIKAKQYHQKYTHLNKKIVLLGIGFDDETRNIGGFELEEL